MAGVSKGEPARGEFTQSFAKLDHPEVVGVVADVREGGLANAPVSEFYLPSALSPPQTAFLVVRTEGDPMRFVNAIRRQLWAVDSSQSISDIKTMDAVYAATLGQRRLTLLWIGSFGGVALLLALVGVYGLIDFTVSQRAPEIGIRRALGATPANILRLVLRRGLLLSVAGGLAGLLGARAMAGFLQELVFEIKPTDAATFASVFVLFVTVALAAAWRPARRASRIDPMTALRSD